MATTMAAPITQPTATNPTQQSTSPPLQRCPCDDEDLFSSAIDDLVEACDRMQQRWPTVTTTLASPLHPNEPTLDRQTQSQPLPTLAYLAEFISDTEDRPDDCPPTPAIHRLPLSFHDTRALQMHVMAKLLAMIGELHEKIDILTAATICPRNSPPASTTNVQPTPVPRLSIDCTSPSPQQPTAHGLLKPQGSLATLGASIFRLRPVPASYARTYKSLIPAKPPYSCGRLPLPLIRTKASMRPP